MFDKIRPNIGNLWDLILFWKRFIDDVFGVWRGTLRQFNLFVQKLNMLAKPFGIQFGDQQVGRSVNYLDVTLYLDDQNQIQYKLFTKETDARLYLKTNSFHPPHGFPTSCPRTSCPTNLLPQGNCPSDVLPHEVLPHDVLPH